MENDEEVKPPIIIKAYNGTCMVFLLLLFLVTWVVGCVLAKGAFSTIVSICFPPWGWYLIVEKIMLAYGLA